MNWSCFRPNHQAKHLSSRPQSAMTITGENYQLILQLRLFTITSNFSVYLCSRISELGWWTSSPEARAWPHGAGGRVEVRAARVGEGHTTSPAPCREDLLWLSRGTTNNFHADKLPASQGQRGRVYLEDLDKLCMFLTSSRTSMHYTSVIC